MQELVHYARYFFYFLRHYGPMLAGCLLYDEIKGERRYQLHTTGFEPVHRIRKVDTSGAYSYMPSNYVLLERVFRKLNSLGHNQTFLDFGCGKGRAMIVAAYSGFRKITGVEIVEDFCRDAQEQICRINKQFPSCSFEVHCRDASTYPISDDVQTIFFYNPFKESVMDAVISRILTTFEQHPRTIYIVYLNPLYRTNFLEAGFKQIYRTTRFRHLEACILVKGSLESVVGSWESAQS